MTRYHFGSVDGVREADPVGAELADDAAARAYAIKYAGEVLQSDPDALDAHGQWRVEVTNDSGRLVCTVVALMIDAPGSEACGPA